MLFLLLQQLSEAVDHLLTVHRARHDQIISIGRRLQALDHRLPFRLHLSEFLKQNRKIKLPANAPQWLLLALKEPNRQ